MGCCGRSFTHPGYLGKAVDVTYRGVSLLRFPHSEGEGLDEVSPLDFGVTFLSEIVWLGYGKV